MPPKKTAPKPKASSSGQNNQHRYGTQRDVENETENGSTGAQHKQTAGNATTTKPPSKKRKIDQDSLEPSKASRRSARGAAKAQPSQQQLLSYLLSSEAEEECRPDDEKEDMKNRGNIKTYSSVLNPFEELMCAVILSRPISHRLGLRTIRTVLNDPYNFNSAKAVRDASEKDRHQAMWDARTQHKGKTADQLGQIADMVMERFTSSDDKDGTQLQTVLNENDHDIDKALSILKERIKGLGNTGLDIFLRRVQWLWISRFPYIDGRTRQALKQLGLPHGAEQLKELLGLHWANLKTKQLAGSDDVARQRRAFVVILERAMGAELENKIDTLLTAAASA